MAASDAYPLDGSGSCAVLAAAVPNVRWQQQVTLFEQRLLRALLQWLAMCAHPVGCAAMAGLVEGEDVLHFADNKAANAGAVNGASSSPDMARIVSALHLRWVQLRISPWIEFVASKANLADLPSRVPDQGVAAATRLIRSMGAERVPFLLPPYRTWDGSA